MRCPKCSYLSYEDVTRCRNCGYDFELAVPPDPAEPPTLDAPLGSRTWDDPPPRQPDDPADDMGGHDETAAVDLPLFDPAPPADAEPPSPRPQSPRRPSRTPEYPSRAAEPPGALDPPPVPIPPAPPPLVVRRTVDVARPAPAAPAPARQAPARTRPAHPPAPALDFDADVEADPGAAELHDAAVREFDARGDDTLIDRGPAATAPVAAAGLGARIGAGLVDAALLLGIDLLVVWLTLRLLGLPASDWRLLPLAPLIGFLFLLDFSYLVTFTTASGQTIGKMLTGVRTTMAGGERVPFGHAVVRSVVVLACAVPFGLGLLPVLFDGEGRGLHDRMAGTRVVPAE